MKIAIIGNGVFISCEQLLRSYDRVIAVDGGALYCDTMHITPFAVIGDMDSLPKRHQLRHACIKNRDQNTTDLQKALIWIEEQPWATEYTIDLFCVTSHDRLDHTLAALSLVQNNPHVRTLYSAWQRFHLIHDQLLLTENFGTNFSLVPLGEAAVVNVAGCEWSGHDIRLDQHRSGISNKITASPAIVTVTEGAVWCIINLLWT